jgi:multidrug efflux pump subunit AcrA (membrane-fusion protein)
MIRSTSHSTRESILHGDGVAYHASIFLILLLVGLSTQPCAAQTGGKVPRVSVVQPVQKTLVYSLPSKPAEIHAAQEATLYARTNGYLQQMLVDFGDAVEKDQLIAVLEAPELHDEVRRAEAQLLEASAQLGAAQANAAGGDSQIIAAKAGHVQAEAAVLQAGAELEKARAVLHAELIHLNRMIHLHEQDAATDAQLESARRDHSQALGDVDIGEKAVTSARAMEGAAAAKIQVAESQKEALVSLVAVAEAAIASANARVDLATTCSCCACPGRCGPRWRPCPSVQPCASLKYGPSQIGACPIFLLVGGDGCKGLRKWVACGARETSGIVFDPLCDRRVGLGLG